MKSKRRASYTWAAFKEDIRTVPVSIYGLVDPRRHNIVYVGRIEDPHHRLIAHQSQSPNRALAALRDEIRSLGLRFEMVILYVAPPGVDSSELESIAIAQHGGAARVMPQGLRQFKDGS